MAFKQFTLSNGVIVAVYKHRGSRSLRVSVKIDGEVRVTIPTWATYLVGVRFAESRKEWISEHSQTSVILVDGQSIGKAHHLHFYAETSSIKVTSRLRGSSIDITHPTVLDVGDAAFQKVVQKACIRALRQEAEQLLPQRLASLAALNGFKYGSISVKQLKGRWGSCDQRSNIVLNLFLMQLPWELIDYVLLHELTHTHVMKHGPDFWLALRTVLPNVDERRKQIKNYQPTLGRSDETTIMA